MFQIGDLIVYGGNGVCRVDDIVARDLTGQDHGREYYMLRPVDNSCVISAPVDSKKVFMRPILTKQEAERLVDRIPTIRAEAFESSSTQMLTAHYEEALKTHDCMELLRLSMSIYRKKQMLSHEKRKFGEVDARFLKRAEELLFSELAAALNITRDQVPDYIDRRVGPIVPQQA